MAVIHGPSPDDRVELLYQHALRGACVKEDNRPTAAPQLLTWTATGGRTPIGYRLPAEAKDRFLEIPPIIVWTEAEHEPLLVMTRVTEEYSERGRRFLRTNVEHPDGGKPPEKLWIDFSVRQVHPEPGQATISPSKASPRCTVNLHDQLSSQSAEQIAQPAFRAIGEKIPEKVTARSILPSKPLAWHAAVVDFAQRWSMSQVLVSERALAGDPQLAVTMVFNGFTGSSFQILLAEKGGYRVTEQVGGGGFVGCDKVDGI